MKHTIRPGLVFLAVIALTVSVISGSFAQSNLWNTTYQFYPSQGYVKFNPMYYLMTDVSDKNLALSLTLKLGFPINYTPRLAYALSPAIRVNPTEFMPTVYYITNVPADAWFDQKLIFSTEWKWPPSYKPVAGDYMPLWRLKIVTWNDPSLAVPLSSEASIKVLEGTDPDQVTITDPGVVAGASILINTNKLKIPQAYVSTKAGYPLVRLPAKGIFAEGQVYKMLQLDYSVVAAANTNKGTYAPLLAKFYMLKLMYQPTASQIIYSFWPQPPVRQLYVAQDAPSSFGPDNMNFDYSPLMNDWTAKRSGPFPSLYTSENAILAAVPPFMRNATSYISYQPIIGQ